MRSALIIGAGPMAIDYCKVLSELNCDTAVIGRGDVSANSFESKTGVKVLRGGVKTNIDVFNGIGKTPVFVVTDETNVGDVTKLVLEAGARNILVEKPGGFDIPDIQSVADSTKLHEASVKVAYNRRYFSSVLNAAEMIKFDGGAETLHFDFSERSHVIEKLKKLPGVKEEWFLSNSTHVIDTAFFLCGYPSTLKADVSGELAWHGAGKIFVGTGVTDRGCRYTYNSNWGAPGNWSIDVTTSQRKLVLNPMERLQVKEIGSASVLDMDIDYSLDEKYKPGIYKMVQDFIVGSSILPSIHQQAEHCITFQAIRRAQQITNT